MVCRMKTLSFSIISSAAGAFTVFAQQNDPTPAVPLLPAAPTQVQAQGAQAQAASAEVVTNSPVTNHPVVLRIVGSNVKNLKGEYLGRIDDVILNPESK